MQTVLAAGLVTAWAAIALLLLGYGRLAADVRELQSRGMSATRTTYPMLAAPGPPHKTVLLALSGSCSTCDTVFPHWLDIATELREAGHRTVTLSLDSSPKWTEGGTESVTADDLPAPFLLTYQPALVVFDHEGGVVSADPDGSVDTLRRLTLTRSEARA